jgi:hypothetical protein
MAFLTDRTLATGVTLQDLIHIVITGDTSQNPAGSSYKATIQQVSDAILFGFTGSTDYYVTGGTYSGGTLVLDRQNGSVTITGFTTGSTDYYVTGGTYSGGTLVLDRQNGSVTITGFTTGSTQLYEVGSGVGSTQRIGVSADASGDYSLVGGGFCNKAIGDYTFIGGGINNTSTGCSSTVSGGRLNTSSGDYSTVSGGFQNSSIGQYSTVSGGYCNIAATLTNAIIGYGFVTYSGTVSGAFSLISPSSQSYGSGTGTIFTINLYSGTVSGYNSPTYAGSTASGYYGPFTPTSTGIPGGSGSQFGFNFSPAGTLSNVYLNSGGQDYTNGDTFTFDGTLFGGGTGTDDVTIGITTSTYAVVSLNNGGQSYSNGADLTFLGNLFGGINGVDNVVIGNISTFSNGLYSTVSGGQCNTSSGCYSTISGGRNNTSSGDNSFIGGGRQNTSSNYYSTVGGGFCNTSSNYYSTVGGGVCNTSSCYYSTISGGRRNTSSGNRSTVGGGESNTSSSFSSTVSGGYRNTACSIFSTVSGGKFNTASGNCSTVSGGYQNISSGCYSFVGGGRKNTASSTYSVIGGGFFNTALCSYSSILGGSGNTVNHEMSATYGKDIVSKSACTFHVNYLALQNTPETDSSASDVLVRDSVTGVIKKTTISSITGVYLPLSGGTVTGGTTFTSGLTANTLNVNGLTQTSGITSTGGITFKQVTINSTYSATTQDYMIDVTGGTFTVYLPSAVGIQGRLLVVKNNGGGAVTVQPTSGQNIDDKPFVILGETNTIQLASNGSNWVAISYNISTVNSSTGVFAFTGLTIASPTTFTVAPVKGWIVNDTTNPLSPQLYYVEYSGGTHTATYVTTATETWVYLTSGGTISQSNINLTDQQRRENIFLGKLGHANKTNIINAFSQPDFVLSPLSQLRDMFDPIGFVNAGIRPSANGVNLSFNTSAGYLHGLGINFANNTLNPNAIYVLGTSPCTFQYRTQTGGTTSNVTVIDPTKYDVGGVITTIPGGGQTSTNQRIYLVQNGVFRVQYGQQTYSNLASAVAGISTEQFVEFSNFSTNGILIGIISVRKDATDLSNISRALFFNVSKFGDATGAAGGTPTTTLQQAYDNSSEPEITTNSTLGPLSVKNGAGTLDNVTNVFEGVNAAGTTTSFVRADGAISASTISATTFNLAGSQIDSAWTSYVPVWTASGTNPVINNGTIEGWYKVIGKTCFVRGNIAMGSTTTFGTGEWYVSMPLTAAHADAILLNGNLLDNGTAWYNVTVNGARSGFNTKAPLQYVNIASGVATEVNPTQPFTWTTGDRFIWNGSYEIT